MRNPALLQISCQLRFGVNLLLFAQRTDKKSQPQQNQNYNKISIQAFAAFTQCFSSCKRFIALSILILIQLYNTDVRQIAVSLVIIQPIAHDKLIRNLETCVVHLYFHHASLRLIKKRTQRKTLWPSVL